MDEKTVGDLVASFGELFAINPDSACRNLAETVLQVIEFKEAARKATEEDFWEESKAVLLNIDSIKNFRVKDILYFTDTSFRNKTNKFFSLLADQVFGSYASNREHFEKLLDWLQYLSESKIREFRNFSIQLLLEVFTGFMKVISNNVKSIREAKAKAADFVFPFLCSMDVYYLPLVKTRINDIENSIRGHIVDHLYEVLTSKAALALDEAWVVLVKRNGQKHPERVSLFRDDPLAVKSLKSLLEGMVEPHIERICRYLGNVAAAVSKAKLDVEDSSYKEWYSQGLKVVGQSVEVLRAFVPHLLKAMVEQREETGVHVVHFFSGLSRHQLFDGFVQKKELSVVFFMVTSAKKKLREAACEFVLEQVGRRGPETSRDDEVRMVNRFLAIVDDVLASYAAKKSLAQDFNEETVLWLMKYFIPKITQTLCHKTLLDLYLGSHDSREDPEPLRHYKGYLGCALITFLRATESLIRDDLPGQRVPEEFKKEGLEQVKEMNASIRTAVKETMKKSLSSKNLKNVEDFAVYLKLVEHFVDESDQGFIDILSNLYDKIAHRSPLRRVAIILRSVFDSHKHSQLDKDYLLEKVQRLFADYTEHFNKVVGKVAKDAKEKGLASVGQSKHLEDLRACLRKLTPLKDLFQIRLEIDPETFANVGLVLDFFISDQLADKEVLESLIVLLRTSLIDLFFRASNGSAEEAVYKERRKLILEYLFQLIQPASLQSLAENRDFSLVRYIFVHLIESLVVISNDQISFQEKTYFNIGETDEHLNKLWDFVDAYCFKLASPPADDQVHVDEADPEPNPRRMDEEAKKKPRRPRSSTHAEEDREELFKNYQLRAEDLQFKEHAFVVVSMVFRLSLELFRSIGCNLAGRLFYRLLNLKAHQEYFKEPMEAFLERLLEREKTQPRLVLWKFVDNCFKSFDLQTLRSLSKAVFGQFKKHQANEELVRGKYFPFCVYLLHSAQEGEEDPAVCQKLPLFIKKAVLGDETTNKLLYGAQHSLQKYLKESDKQDIDAIADAKYLHLRAIRDTLATICQKNLKEDHREGETSTVRKPRRSKSLKKPMDEEDQLAPADREDAPSKDASQPKQESQKQPAKNKKALAAKSKKLRKTGSASPDPAGDRGKHMKKAS